MEVDGSEFGLGLESRIDSKGTRGDVANQKQEAEGKNQRRKNSPIVLYTKAANEKMEKKRWQCNPCPGCLRSSSGHVVRTL